MSLLALQTQLNIATVQLDDDRRLSFELKTWKPSKKVAQLLTAEGWMVEKSPDSSSTICISKSEGSFSFRKVRWGLISVTGSTDSANAARSLLASLKNHSLIPTNITGPFREGYFGICTWTPEKGSKRIHQDDLVAITTLNPQGKIFQCVSDGPYLRLKYGDDVIRVRPEFFSFVDEPMFKIEDRVKAICHGKEEEGLVVGILWDEKKLVHIYQLSFQNRRSSRRYIESEINKI